MSAADRIVVRTRSGAVRVVTRRTGLGLISTGRATATKRAKEPAPRAEVKPAPKTKATPKKPESAPKQEAAPVPPIVQPEPIPEPVTVPEAPKAYASKSMWADYARQLDVTVTENMTKRQIQAAANDRAESLARLSQPAREGGRLANPGDEPVTEAVTDAHPGIE